MPRNDRSSDDAALRAALALGLEQPVGHDAQRLATFLARVFGPATVALLHYGSHAQRVPGGEASAWDFFVVVDDYRAAYRALAAVQPRFPAGRAAFLNRLLPPNVISVTAPGLPARTAKCCVLSVDDLVRACGPRPLDHFTRARLFQLTHLVWSRDEAGREQVAGAVMAARRGTFEWSRPFLPGRFDARSYLRTLLEISYAAEIRPEDDQHLDVLLGAQAGILVPVAETLLAHFAALGRLGRVGDVYRDPWPPGSLARAFARLWFGWSKMRATLRWAKYMALYEDWLDYVVRKVERRSGVTLELTERERRWPLIFLWPKAVRFIGRRRPRPS